MLRRRRAQLAPLACALLLAACGHGEAQDPLQAMVDSVLPQIEAVSGMKLRAPVKAARRDRSELRQYLTQRFDEEMPARETAALEATYKELGLLPDSMSLRRLLLDLYTEQVIGFYDPPTKTFYLIKGISTKTAEPVVAHELVHALQDQYVDLDSVVSPDVGNDRATAAQAAVEGHATLVMYALLLRERTSGEQDITQLPDIGSRLRPMLEGQNSQFPVFASAPLVVKETLMFPYLDGADFIQTVWREHPGSRPSFRSMLPSSTEQVMHPLDHFIHHRDAPSTVTLAPPPAGWKLVYEDALGELGTGIVLRQHLGAGADSLARGWDGDVIRLLETPIGERMLVLASVWDDAPAADRFADAWRRVLDARPRRHGSVRRLEIDGRPAVLIEDASRGVPLSALPPAAIVSVAEGDTARAAAPRDTAAAPSAAGGSAAPVVRP